MSEDALPSFKNPPVIETVLGVQFDPVSGLTNAHLGAFWKRISKDWPQITDATPLDPVFEQFGDTAAWGKPGLQFRLSESPAIRLRIRNSLEDRMIQLQNGRLHYNWLKKSGEQYARYRAIRPEFDHTLRVFQEFLKNESLGEVQPNQWEVTYVNHVPKGTVWNGPQDWTLLFPPLPGPARSSPRTRLESFGGQWHFEIEPQRGRLHVEVRHGRLSSAEGGEVLVLNLTARGPAGIGQMNLSEGLDLGHETIVRAFKELTSDQAHEFWGLQNEDT